MKKTLISIAAVIGLTAAGGAFAQDAGADAGMAADLDFATLDADASGEVSLEELQTAMPDATEEDFTTYDADGSGGLSEEELTAWTEAEGGAAAGGDAMAGEEEAPAQ